MFIFFLKQIIMKEYINYINYTFALIFKEIYECHNNEDYNKITAVNIYYIYKKFLIDNITDINEIFNINSFYETNLKKYGYDYETLSSNFDLYFMDLSFCEESDYTYEEEDIFKLMIFIKLLNEFFIQLLNYYERFKDIIDKLYNDIKLKKQIDFDLNLIYQDVCDVLIENYTFYLVGKDFFKSFRDYFKSKYDSKYKVCYIHNGKIVNLNKLIYEVDKRSEFFLDYLLKKEEDEEIKNFKIRKQKNIKKTIMKDDERLKIYIEKLEEELSFDEKISIKLKHDEIIYKLYSEYFTNEFKIRFILANELKLYEYLNKDGIFTFNKKYDLNNSKLKLFLRTFFDINDKNDDIFSIFSNINDLKREIEKKHERFSIIDHQITLFNLRFDLLIYQKKNIIYKLYYLDFEYMEKEKDDKYEKIKEKLNKELDEIILKYKLYYHVNAKIIKIYIDGEDCQQDLIITKLIEEFVSNFNEKIKIVEDDLETDILSNTILKEKISEYEKKIVELNTELTKKSDKIEELRKQYSHDRKSKVSRNKIKPSDLTDNIKILTDEYLKLSNEIEEFKNLIKEIQSNYDKNTEIIDKKKRKLEILENELKQVLKEINYSIGGKKIIKKNRQIRKYKLIS